MVATRGETGQGPQPDGLCADGAPGLGADERCRLHEQGLATLDGVQSLPQIGDGRAVGEIDADHGTGRADVFVFEERRGEDRHVGRVVEVSRTVGDPDQDGIVYAHVRSRGEARLVDLLLAQRPQDQGVTGGQAVGIDERLGGDELAGAVGVRLGRQRVGRRPRRWSRRRRCGPAARCRRRLPVPRTRRWRL